MGTDAVSLAEGIQLVYWDRGRLARTEREARKAFYPNELRPYQKLAYILETRHRDLLAERSPIHRRSRKRDK